MSGELYDFESVRFKMKISNGKFVPTSFNDFSSIDSRITKKGIYKLYILKHIGEFLYVGRAKNSIRQRFKSGLDRNRNPKNGYHGYKWIGKFIDAALDIECCIIIFKNLPSVEHIEAESSKNIEYRLKNPEEALIEAIEAEVVYAIRYYEQYWPKFQHETHFYNLFPSKVKATATQIYFTAKEKFDGGSHL